MQSLYSTVNTAWSCLHSLRETLLALDDTPARCHIHTDIIDIVVLQVISSTFYASGLQIAHESTKRRRWYLRAPHCLPFGQIVAKNAHSTVVLLYTRSLVCAHVANTPDPTLYYPGSNWNQFVRTQSPEFLAPSKVSLVHHTSYALSLLAARIGVQISPRLRHGATVRSFSCCSPFL